MKLMKLQRLSLAWLARQERPVWGGHFDRGEPVPPGSELEQFLAEGLIEQVGYEGYRITPSGRRALVEAANPQHEAGT